MILKSMSRSNRGRFIAITHIQWKHLRTLARKHGWKPCGTIDPGLGLEDLKTFEKNGWGGGYDCPRFQKTTDADAYSLSHSLASALQHYVDSKILLGYVLGIKDKVFFHDNFQISECNKIKFERLIEDRINGKPVSRIIGRRNFWKNDVDMVA